MKIALCDDMSIQQDMLKDQVIKFGQLHDIDFEVSAFNSGMALLDDMSENGPFDIYVLDIIMAGMKGNEVAARIRESDKNGYIIFFTATNTFKEETDKFQPSSYMLKTINRSEFFSVLENALNTLKNDK